jgi:hypothetical protein
VPKSPRSTKIGTPTVPALLRGCFGRTLNFQENFPNG